MQKERPDPIFSVPAATALPCSGLPHPLASPRRPLGFPFPPRVRREDPLPLPAQFRELAHPHLGAPPPEPHETNNSGRVLAALTTSARAFSDFAVACAPAKATVPQFGSRLSFPRGRRLAGWTPQPALPPCGWGLPCPAHRHKLGRHLTQSVLKPPSTNERLTCRLCHYRRYCLMIVLTASITSRTSASVILG